MIEHPFLFFLAFFTATFTLGAWGGFQIALWRIRCLERRIEMLKLEIQMGKPIYFPEHNTNNER